MKQHFLPEVTKLSRQSKLVGIVIKLHLLFMHSCIKKHNTSATTMKRFQAKHSTLLVS